MAEIVEGGATLAWRLLATLEGGSLLLAASALLAYSARKRVLRAKRTRRHIKTVLLTNSTSALGKELKTRLEARGCVVSTLPEDSTTGADSAPGRSVAVETRERVDALVVVGAHASPRNEGLQALADLVSEDVYSNLKYLESLSCLVRRGGCVSWACAGCGGGGEGGGNFNTVGPAFDTVIKATLEHLAKINSCEAVWVGRCPSTRTAADRVVDALMAGADPQRTDTIGFSIRNVARKVGRYIYRWLKMVT